MAIDLLIVRVLAYGVLLHEGFGLCINGSGYLKRCFLPTLGLHLAPSIHATLHLALIGVSGCLIINPRLWWLYPAFLILLSLVIASYSLRLSNHLALAWFLAVILCCGLLFQSPESRATQLAPAFLIGLKGVAIFAYFFAVLHKLNYDFLSLQSSWASRLAEFYCHDIGFKSERVIKAMSLIGIYGTLLAEASIPVVLLSPQAVMLGVCCGILFHFVIGLMEVMHFSTVMYACLLAFVPPWAVDYATREMLSHSYSYLLVCGLLSIFITWKLVPRKGYTWKRAARAIQFSFVFFSVALLIGCSIVLYAQPTGMGGSNILTGVDKIWLVLIWGLFILNGFSPYLGLKTEFCLAMFSNLRCEPWRHLVIPANWRLFDLARYVKIKHIEGLPEHEQLQGDSAAQVALNLLSKSETYLYSSYFFHEALERLYKAAQPKPAIRVSYTVRGNNFEMDELDIASGSNGTNCLRLNLFPFVMPIDPAVPHSELGSLPAGTLYPKARRKKN